MPIQINITLQPGESLVGMLREAGLIHTHFDLVEGGVRVGPVEGGVRVGAADGSFTHSIRDAWNVAPSSQPEPAPAPAAEPPKRGPGRPRKTEAATEPAGAVETKPAVYTVRRYGGMVEGEYPDSGQAAEALIELVREAHDIEALNSLMAANGDDMKGWPAERIIEATEAAAAVRTVLKTKAEPPAEKPAEPAPTSGPHFALDGTVLKAITADKQGAMNGVNAVVAAEGGSGGPGYTAARAYMDELGVPKVSALADNDDRLPKLAAWCAQRLGLPIAGAAESLA